MYFANGSKPACHANRCGIVDVAPDINLNKKVNAFFQVEALDQSPAYAQFQRKAIEDSGLDVETVDTILEMKTILAEYREWMSKHKSAPKIAM